MLEAAVFLKVFEAELDRIRANENKVSLAHTSQAT